MKILMVITELGPGGAERIVYDLSKTLICRGHQLTVVSLQSPPSVSVIPDALTAAGAEVLYLSGSKRDLFLWWKLRKIILQKKPDLIHAHLIHANLLSRLAAAFTKIPLVNTVHIAERRRGKQIFFLLDRLTAFLANAHTAVSKAAAEFHEKRCRMPHEIFQVIYNASDAVVPASPEVLQNIRQQLGLYSCHKIIGSVGRLNYQKGYDWFLEGLPDLSAKIPKDQIWGILIFGDGPEMEKLQILAEKIQKQCTNLKIFLPGYRPDAASCMVLFDVFVMPSRYEGYGLTLTEAFSLGLPVVCSKADSLPELCNLYRGNSFLFDMREDQKQHDREDRTAMVNAIFSALQFPRTQGQILVTSEEMTDAYLQLYRKICR